MFSFWFYIVLIRRNAFMNNSYQNIEIQQIKTRVRFVIGTD